MQTAKLTLDGTEYEFPVTVGTEDEVGIDFSALRSRTGAIALDPGREYYLEQRRRFTGERPADDGAAAHHGSRDAPDSGTDQHDSSVSVGQGGVQGIYLFKGNGSFPGWHLFQQRPTDLARWPKSPATLG